MKYLLLLPSVIKITEFAKSPQRLSLQLPAFLSSQVCSYSFPWVFETEDHKYAKVSKEIYEDMEMDYLRKTKGTNSDLKVAVPSAQVVYGYYSLSFLEKIAKIGRP